MQIKRLRTDTGWQRSVPRPAFTTQTHQFLTAPKTVARVTAEGHRAPCKMTSIVNLVAELWGPWVLTSDELETWGRQKNSNHGNRAKLLLSSHPPPPSFCPEVPPGHHCGCASLRILTQPYCHSLWTEYFSAALCK